MKTLPTTAAGTLLMLVLVSTSPADAQASIDSPGAKFINRLLTGGPRWTPVSTFDVAGVRLGMTPQEARTALKGAGFSLQATDPMQDAWSSVVSRRAAERGAGKAA